MTEPIEPATTAPVAPAPSADAVAVEPKPSWWGRLRPRSRLPSVAAAVVAAAVTVLIGVGIFAAGFALGADGGEHSWQADDHEGHHSEDAGSGGIATGDSEHD